VDDQQAETLNRAGFEARVALFEAIRLRAEGATSAQLVNLAEAWAWLTSPAQPHGSSAAPKGGA
jgi:squalene cyclase